MIRFARVFLMAAVVCALSAGEARSDLLTLTFDELPVDTPLDPSVSVGRITFRYDDGPFAVYNSFNTFQAGVDALYLDGGVLEGDTLGTLTIDFRSAALELDFALALSDFGTYLPGFSVELFGPGLVSLGTFGVVTTPLVPGTGFSEGLFSYRGTRIRRAVIPFDAGVSSTVFTFALDNMRAMVVPEPSTGVLAGVGLVGIAVLAGGFAGAPELTGWLYEFDIDPSPGVSR